MAEEPIVFPISDDGGTARLIAALEALGVSANEAGERVASATGQMSGSLNAAALATELLQEALSAGVRDIQAFAEALTLLSEAELQAALESETLASALSSLAAAQEAAASTSTALALSQAEVVEALQAMLPAIVGSSSAARELVAQYQSLIPSTEAFGQAQRAIADESNIIDGEFREVSQSVMALGASYQSASAGAVAFANSQRTVASATTATQTAGMNTAAMWNTLGGNATSATQAFVGLNNNLSNIPAQFNAVRTAASNLMSSFTGLIGQIGLFVTATAAIHDIDALQRINQGLELVTGNAENGAAAFNRLENAALANHQSLETLSNTFTNLAASAHMQGLSTETAIQATENLASAFAHAGITGVTATRVLREITEVISNGGHASQQLNAIMRDSAVAASVFEKAFGLDINALKEHNDAVGQASTALEKAKNAQSDLQNHTTNAASALKSFNMANMDGAKALGGVNFATGQYTASLGALVNAANRDRQVELDVAAQRVKSAQMTYDSAIRAREAFSLQAFASAAAADALKQLPPIQQTISGAVTDLTTRFMAFINATGDSNKVIEGFNTVLTEVANLLPILIPLVVALGAAWATVKIADIVVQFYNLTEAMTVLIARNPLVTAGLIALTAAAILFFNHTETGKAALAGLGTEMDAIQQKIMAAAKAHDALTQSTNASNNATQQYSLSITDLSSDQLATIAAMRDAGASFDTIQKQITEYKEANDKAGQSVQSFAKGQADATDLTYDAMNALTKAQGATTDLGTTSKNVTNNIGDDYQDLSHTITNSVEGSLNTTSNAVDVWADKVSSKVQSIIQQINSAGNAASALPASSGGSGVPASRDGSSFTVPGGSGVDSRLIAVSPGEHVTVTTPAQHYGQSAMPTGEPVARFRDGGSFDLSNVSAAYNASNDNIVGYAPIKDADYYTNSSGTVQSQDSINAQIAAAVAAATAAAVKNTVASATATTVQSASSQFSSISSGDTSASSGVSGSDTSPNGQKVDASGNLVADATRAQKQAKAAAVLADTQALNAAYVVTAVGGVSKPDDSLAAVGGPISVAQAQRWTTNGTSWFPSAGDTETMTYAGDFRAAYATLVADQQKPANAFRDGGSFTVPGSSGVDSKLMQLAVSPGEQISVRTPQQQRDSEQPQQLTRGVTVNQYIRADDANSFRKSKKQIASDAKRTIAGAR